MEIGQQFLMPKKSRIIQPRELSIHIFQNGFSFCTSSKIDFVSSLNNNSNFKTELDDYLGYYTNGDFDSFSIILFQYPSTFVPQNLFNKKQSKLYLSLYHKALETDIVAYDTLEEVEQVNVYSFPESIKNILEEANVNFQYVHYNTLLYRIILNLSLSDQFSNQLFVHFQSQAMDIFLVQQNQVLFQNQFAVTNEDEFLYYLFFVIEQFDLESKEFQITFLGKLAAFENYYKIVKQYHSYTSFADKHKILSNDLSLHQAPFLSCYFK